MVHFRPKTCGLGGVAYYGHYENIWKCCEMDYLKHCAGITLTRSIASNINILYLPLLFLYNFVATFSQILILSSGKETFASHYTWSWQSVKNNKENSKKPKNIIVGEKYFLKHNFVHNFAYFCKISTSWSVKTDSQR